MKTNFFFLLFVAISIISGCEIEDGTETPVGSTLTINTTSEIPTGDWTDRGVDVDYIVKVNVPISGGKIVTIGKAVTIQFEGTNSGITVTGTSVLKMQGTQNEPIVLKGQSPVKGNWKGIILESAHPDNVWEYVTISDAGSVKASIYINGTALKPSLKNCTITNSANHGIYLNTATIEFLSFVNNTISNCTNAPLYIYPQSIFTIGTGNKFSNNTNAFIQVPNSTMTTPTVWNKMDVPYRVTEIETSSKLEIKPGTTIEFNPTGGIYIGDKVLEKSTGIIVANGTSTERIVFRGLVNNIVGQWAGVVINSSNVENSMKYCSVLEAGSNVVPCSKHKIALRIGKESNCTAIAGKGTYQNITIKNSGGYGLGYRTTDAVNISGFVYDNNILGNIFNY